MNIIIPVWFYGFDSAMYFVSSLVGFLLSYYFHKIYSISSDKKHMYVYLGFLLLSTGLLSLAVTDMFSYAAFKSCQASHGFCILGVLDEVFSTEDFSYFLYFGLSIIAYALFIMAYARKQAGFSKIFTATLVAYLVLVAASVPAKNGQMLWYSYSEYFHLISLAMLVFVSFNNILHYKEKKSLNSLLVVFSFGMISLSHLFFLFSSVGGLMYVLAHTSMLAGFIALLTMVMRVTKK